MQKSESIKELATALNKAQSQLQIAKRQSENPYFKSKYADLLSVWNACKDALSANGLSISQVTDVVDGQPCLQTVLMHTSGEWIMGTLPLQMVKTDPQAQGSAITYARRYALAAIVGLCTEEDDDAEAAMDRGKNHKAFVERVKKEITEATDTTKISLDSLLTIDAPGSLLKQCPEHGEPWHLNKFNRRSHRMPDGSWCNFRDQIKPILKQIATKAEMTAEQVNEWCKTNYGKTWSALSEETQVEALSTIKELADAEREETEAEEKMAKGGNIESQKITIAC